MRSFVSSARPLGSVLFDRVFRSSTFRHVAKRTHRHVKRLLLAGLGALALASGLVQAGQMRALPPPARVRRALFVRVNFRIGNTLLSTALLGALRARYPHARIDVLAAEPTALLFQGLPVDRVYSISRRFVFAPWRLARLFAELRRRGYDLAFDGGLTSLSSALYMLFAGVRERVGKEGASAPLLTVKLPIEYAPSAHALAESLATALEVPAACRPLYEVAPRESEAAFSLLCDLGIASRREAAPFIAVFVGGHRQKRWSWPRWHELLTRLDAGPVPVVAIIGPEESAIAGDVRTLARKSLRVAPPLSIRSVAAVIARARTLVTPDSGPMHLAAALGVPVVALIETERSRYFVPPGERNEILFRADAEAVLAALQEEALDA
jgi:heptosyltransferase-3